MMKQKTMEPKGRAAAPQWGLWLGLLLGAGALIQLLLAFFTEGYSYDMSCFFSWALRMAERGPADFYAADYFCDYPPGYLLILGLVGHGMKLLDLNYTQSLARVLLCLPTVAASCGLTALVWRIGREHLEPRQAFGLAAFAQFCPVLLYDTAIWKQIDTAFALPLVLCFWLLSQKRYLPGALCYGLALVIKPQALLAGPVLALCFLLPLLERRDRAQWVQVLRNGALGAVLALAPVLLCGLLFFGPADCVPSLISRYLETSSSYPYACINAFNWMGALGANWQSQDILFGPLSWQSWGSAAILLLTAATLWLAWKSAKAGRFCPMLLAAFYTLGIFTFAHRMHERYLVMGLLLLLAAAARWGDKRLLGGALGLSLTGLVNLVQVYSLVGTDDEFMSSTLSVLCQRLFGLAETGCFLLVAWGTVALLTGREKLALPQPQAESTLPPLPQPRWTRREKLALALLTLGTAVVSLWNLGDLTAPQNQLDVSGGSQSVTVSTGQAAAELWVYSGISTDGKLYLYDSTTGAELTSLELSYPNPFRWTALTLPANSGSYTVTVNNARVMELSFRDGSGAQLAVTGGGDSPLFDEQDKVPQKISYRNSTYFDEIYHARTGYEMGHQMEVYETTHPPLGKDFIMLGILIFGMTGFGWRISGVLFGIAMIPVMYLLARRLTRRREAAFAAAALLALDFMRFTQTRIATIDVYGTFFILLGAYFMVWYCQAVLEQGVHHALLPMGLCGLAFGLGCASKWTGIYAGAGLAILYFGVLWARWRQKPKTFGQEAVLALAGGVVFFVCLPVLVYLLSYLPYRIRDPQFSLGDWWNCQTYMYWYHSSLEATHPFESRWYTWPLSLRPVWYYANSSLGQGLSSSIAALGNPVVWWGGLVSLLTLGWRQLSGKGSRAGAAILVLFGVQVLPWVMVSRCTFIYHYFPGMIFGLLALTLLLAEAWQAQPKRAKALTGGLLLAAALLFVGFYPVLSGLEVPSAWLEGLKLLPTWGW